MKEKAGYPIFAFPQSAQIDYRAGENFHRCLKGRPAGISLSLVYVLAYQPFGNVWVAIEWFAERLGLLTLTHLKRMMFSQENLLCKPDGVTQKTIEIGAGHSPETICFAYKPIFGSLIESAESFEKMKREPNLKNHLVLYLSHESSGPCRERMYSRLQEAALQDCYRKEFGRDDFEFYAVRETQRGLLQFVWFLWKISSRSWEIWKLWWIKSLLNEAIKRLYLVEEFEKETRYLQCLISESGFYRAEEILEKVREAAAGADLSFGQLRVLIQAKRQDLEKLVQKYKVRDEPKARAALTGEIFIIEEIESVGGDIVRESAKMGCLLVSTVGIDHYLPRFELTLTRLFKYSLGRLNPFRRNKTREAAARGGLKHKVGGHSDDTIALLEGMREAEEKGESIYDGVIEVEPFPCLPQIIAINVSTSLLYKYKGKIPFLRFIFTEQTGREGIRTRLEAFWEMIERKKRNKDVS